MSILEIMYFNTLKVIHVLNKLCSCKYEMEDTCCVVDKRKTPCVEPSSIKKIKETDFNFFVIVQFVHQKLLDM